MEIRVRHSRTIFSGELYQVVVLKTIEGYEKTSFTACGNLPKLSKREEIIVIGDFKTNDKFGHQFQITSWKRPIPDTTEQLVKFFSSSLFKGIGKKMAEKIVAEVGKKGIKTISNQGVAALKNIEGLKEEVALEIVETVHRTFVLNELIEQYAGYGLPSEILMKAHMYLGQSTYELKENPYLLAHHQLIHFSTADEIGKRMGTLPHAQERLFTMIHLGLREWITSQGHCYLEEKDFITKCLSVLNQGVSNDIDKVHANSLIQALENSKETFIEKGLIYPTSIYFAERDLATNIHQLTLGENHYESQKVESAILEFEKTKNSLLTLEQRSVIHELLQQNVLILTGGPGTGKTYTLNGLLTVYKALFPNANVALAAPTGRAAKKVGEVTGMGSHAQTLHRLLGIGVFGNDRPLFDSSIPLPQDLFIVDEFSMVDAKLASMLVSAIQKGSKLLIVGDPDQLPSVGAGNVLKDLISANIPQVHLTEIFRQAKESTIVRNAHAINEGTEYDFSNQKDHFFLESKNHQRTAELVVATVCRFLEKGYDLQDIMVLSPMKKGTTGIESLNNLIREKVNPKSSKRKEVEYLKQLYREGDKVMFTANNRELDVYNGDTGIISLIDKADNKMIVDINGRSVVFYKENWKHLQLSYSMTIHKAQGGSAKVVISTLTEEHDLMLTRNLFFTAITRAESIFILIGSKESTNKAISTNRVRDRKTTLAARILQTRQYVAYAKCN